MFACDCYKIDCISRASPSPTRRPPCGGTPCLGSPPAPLEVAPDGPAESVPLFLPPPGPTANHEHCTDYVVLLTAFGYLKIVVRPTSTCKKTPT